MTAPWGLSENPEPWLLDLKKTISCGSQRSPPIPAPLLLAPAEKQPRLARSLRAQGARQGRPASPQPLAVL